MRDFEPAVPGPKLLTAYALAVVELTIVHRGTLRALLPAGHVKRYGGQQYRTKKMRGTNGSGVNTTTRKFQTALCDFEKEGWIQRGTEYVRVVDRRGLLDYVLAHFPQGLPSTFLDLNAAVDSIHAQAPPASEAVREQRRLELLALDRLMREAPAMGAHWSGKGSVKFIRRSRPL